MGNQRLLGEPRRILGGTLKQKYYSSLSYWHLDSRKFGLLPFPLPACCVIFGLSKTSLLRREINVASTLKQPPMFATHFISFSLPFC